MSQREPGHPPTPKISTAGALGIVEKKREQSNNHGREIRKKLESSDVRKGKRVVKELLTRV